MDELQIMELSAQPLLVTLPICLIGGMGLGYVYFCALRGTATLIVSGGDPLFGMALSLGRVLLLVAGFTLAVLAGGLPLIAALAGVLIARFLVVRHIGSTGS